MLSDAGVKPILVNLHYFAEKVTDYIKISGFKDIVETVYEEKLLGTAGTFLKNRDFFQDESLMLVHADNLSKFNVGVFIEQHKKRPAHCEITMMTFATPSPESCGIVELDDQGVVRAFHEKNQDPPGNLANGAVYIVEPSVFEFLDSLGKEKIDFSTEVLPNYLERICTFHNDIYHRDIGTIESYEAATREYIYD
jgi:mannose-1-phosphate guanylyltransferase